MAFPLIGSLASCRLFCFQEGRLNAKLPAPKALGRGTATGETPSSVKCVGIL
jgi:hypothetical protein